MKQELIDTFFLKNGECFEPFQLVTIKQKLAEVSDEKSPVILGLSFQKPTFILIVAILLGLERFFLDDIGLAIIKILTCYGCGIWWIIDIFSAKKRTYDYNMHKLDTALYMCK